MQDQEEDKMAEKKIEITQIRKEVEDKNSVIRKQVQTIENLLKEKAETNKKNNEDKSMQKRK